MSLPRKDLYTYHKEITVDEDYSNRQKVNIKDINIMHLIVIAGLQFFVMAAIAILSVIVGAMIDQDEISSCIQFLFGASTPMIFIILYQSVMLAASIKESQINNKIYKSAIVYNIVFIIIDLIMFRIYSNKLIKYTGIIGTIINLLFIVAIIVMIVAIVFVAKKMKAGMTGTQTTCTLAITGKCIGYEPKVVERDAQMTNARRAASVAYSTDQYCTVYIPVFNIIFNGKSIVTKPNYSSTTQEFTVGANYNIFINPDNPVECRVK